MWQIFQKIVANKLTPNQCLILYGLSKRISTGIGNQDDYDNLIKEGFTKLDSVETSTGLVKHYPLTQKGKKLIIELDNYFLKAKKKTNIQLMGKDFLDKISSYREIFPAKKLPSGKPARNNVKTLNESFRWFFETYDYDWDTIIDATRMYVNEYRANDYMYMQTSQYFISKQDKHRVKHSALADYCDMVIDGVDTEDDHFKEKVV